MQQLKISSEETLCLLPISASSDVTYGYHCMYNITIKSATQKVTELQHIVNDLFNLLNSYEREFEDLWEDKRYY